MDILTNNKDNVIDIMVTMTMVMMIMRVKTNGGDDNDSGSDDNCNGFKEKKISFTTNVSS